MESKLQIYNRMMSTLHELKTEFINEASLAIQKRVLLMEEFRTSIKIGLYCPYGNEVMTDMLFTESDKHRRELYYPAKSQDKDELSFYRIINLEHIIPTKCGIKITGEIIRRLRDENELDVLLVPGIAFDLHGARLGEDETLYNTVLDDFRGTRIALAYDFQIVSESPVVLRKKRVDLVVTEKRIIKSI